MGVAMGDALPVVSCMAHKGTARERQRKRENDVYNCDLCQIIMPELELIRRLIKEVRD